MILRAFGGYNFTEEDLASEEFVALGYRKGVPMGGDLVAQGDLPPSFLLMATKDPLGANLDRIQVVKGWLEKGIRREQVYDAVFDRDRKIDKNGKLEPVGSTVNLESASYLNSIGNAELSGIWEDPNFTPGQAAVYYVRVLEIPTPRWTLYDKVRYQLKNIPENVPMTIQERAYASAIWYLP
jgi:hypothetical protein